ncbi:MAG: YceD family protein [Thermodesulfobacteriota bacterium]
MNALKAKTLQIAIKAIPDAGKEVAIDLGPEWFTQWRTEDPGLEFADARITGSVNLAKHGHDILVRGHLEGHLDLACSRCLESFTQPVAAEFDLLLAPGPGTAAPEEEELSPTDLDLDYYTGEVVDLESILREQIILMIPVKPLCDEICKGLCPQCGANLNRETCNCRPEAVDSPFAHLAKLKI